METYKLVGVRSSAAQRMAALAPQEIKVCS